jgi:hypothetical protein
MVTAAMATGKATVSGNETSPADAAMVQSIRRWRMVAGIDLDCWILLTMCLLKRPATKKPLFEAA